MYAVAKVISDRTVPKEVANNTMLSLNCEQDSSFKSFC